jgi:DNA repair ATPase RecN
MSTLALNFRYDLAQGDCRSLSECRGREMAEPVSVAASVLAIITAAVQTTKSLCETVKRFKDRNKTLSRLQNELEDLGRILDSLAQVTHAENSVLTLLQGPIDRCNQVCREFEQSMKGFTEKSKTSILDWAKLEFMRGDINEFIDTIAGYKSTISVGVGTIILLVARNSLGCSGLY